MAGRGNVQVKIQTEYDGSGINRAEQGVSRFGTTAQKHAKEAVAANTLLTGSFKSMARQAVTAGAGFAAAYIGVSKAKSAIETTETLAKTTENLTRNFGLTTKAASTWAAVLQSRNIDPTSLQLSFTALSKAIEGAGKGSKPATAAFKDLGISQRDLKDQNFQQTLGAVTTALTKMEGGSKRAADAQTLLGRGAKTLAPLMREGALGFQQQAKWAEQYHVTLDGHAIKSSKELAAASEQLKFAQLGLQIAFTEKVAPAILTVEKAASRVIRIFNDPKLTPTEKVDQIEHLFEQLGNKAEHVFEEVAPKVMDEAAKLAPKAAQAFVTAWWHAGVWGKLFTIALLSKKLGLFSTVGTLAANQWGGSFKKRVATQAEKAAVEAAGTQGLASAGALAAMATAGEALGLAAGVAAYVAFFHKFHIGSPHTTGRAIGNAIIHGGQDIGHLLGGGSTPHPKNPRGLAPPGGGSTGHTAPTRHPHGHVKAHGGSVGAHGASAGTSTHVKARAAGIGGTYSFGQIQAIWVGAGGDPSKAALFAHIAMCESTGNAGVVNSIGATGLWQIYNHPDLVAKYGDMRNPTANAKAAISLSGNGVNLRPWTASQACWQQFVGAPSSRGGGGGIQGITVGSSGGSFSSSAVKAPPPPIVPKFPTRLRNAIRSEQHAFTGFQQQASDVDRRVSQYERRGDFRGAADLLGVKLTDEKRMRSSAKAALRGYQRELKILRHQMRTAPPGRRSKIAAAIKDVMSKIADLKGTVHELGFDIGDTKLDIKDELSQGAADTAGADTSGAAQAAADQAAADQALTDQIAGLRADVQEQTRVIAGTSGITESEIRRAFVGMLNGDLGGYAYPRTLTPGAGGRAQY